MRHLFSAKTSTPGIISYLGERVQENYSSLFLSFNSDWFCANSFNLKGAITKSFKPYNFC